MNTYTTEELLEAKRSIASTLGKCEKALLKLTPGKSQHTLTVRRIRAFQIALELLDGALKGAETHNTQTEANNDLHHHER